MAAMKKAMKAGGAAGADPLSAPLYVSYDRGWAGSPTAAQRQPTVAEKNESLYNGSIGTVEGAEDYPPDRGISGVDQTKTSSACGSSGLMFEAGTDLVSFSNLMKQREGCLPANERGVRDFFVTMELR